MSLLSPFTAVQETSDIWRTGFDNVCIKQLLESFCWEVILSAGAETRKLSKLKLTLCSVDGMRQTEIWGFSQIIDQSLVSFPEEVPPRDMPTWFHSRVLVYWIIRCSRAGAQERLSSLGFRSFQRCASFRQQKLDAGEPKFTCRQTVALIQAWGKEHLFVIHAG